LNASKSISTVAVGGQDFALGARDQAALRVLEVLRVVERELAGELRVGLARRLGGVAAWPPMRDRDRSRPANNAIASRPVRDTNRMR
jgi:hypothetical protein